MEENLQVQNQILGKTFFWMFLGLLGSGLVAWYTYSSGLLLNIIAGNSFTALLLLELVVVLVFSLLFKKLSPMMVSFLYFVYAMVNGVTLSVVFYTFELSSVVYVFGISALLFAILAFMGYQTQKDLTSWGSYLSVFLIGGILLSVINLFFLKNSGFEILLDWFILVLFFGITIYDINKIKILQQDPHLNTEKIHVYCAMQLYLDFINIFLRLLSLFGKSKNN